MDISGSWALVRDQTVSKLDRVPIQGLWRLLAARRNHPVCGQKRKFEKVVRKWRALRTTCEDKTMRMKGLTMKRMITGRISVFAQVLALGFAISQMATPCRAEKSTATTQVSANAKAGKAAQTSANRRLFTEAESNQADFIVRYNDDRTSYVVKPVRKEVFAGHEYYTIFERAGVLKEAAAAPGRGLAIIMIPHYPNMRSDLEETIKLGWANDLAKLGYQRVLFGQGDNKVEHVQGMPVLTDPQMATVASIR
jgi:hypothetical protein